MSAGHEVDRQAPVPVPPTEASSRGVARFLRKLKGQIETSGPTTSVYGPPTIITSSSASNSNVEVSDDIKEGGVTARRANDGLEQFYVPIDSYEGRHRYDPTARWTELEEKRLIRKLDLRICAWCCLMFFALQLDRSNIAQALSDNMLNDLHINRNDYNYGQTIFYISFLLAELPSQLISKKLGPDNWIPIQMVSWSIVTCAQSQISGRSTFYLTRALLGLIEGGFIPDIILYLSYFYTSKELPIRLSFFWGSYGLTYIVSAFLAYGILRLRGTHGMAGWQWLFALEGTLTGLLGIVSYFYLPPSPTQTASWFRGKAGWFSAREETIMVNRVLRDDPSKGDMHNRQAITPALLWHALTDYDMWPVYVLGLTWGIPQQPAQSYITLILKDLGFGTLTTNLLTVPAYALFIAQLLLWTWVSERWNNRFAVVLLCQIWMLPLLTALAVLPGGAAYRWPRYVIEVLLVGYPYIHAIIVAITSRNAGSVRTRTVGTALYNMCVQASNIISSNVYRDDDQPLYRRGNRILLGILAWNFAVIVFCKLYYRWRNAARERVWGAMGEEARAEYLATTKDRGNKRLDFRFAH